MLQSCGWSWGFWAFDPVEPVSAEQDEVDEDRQREQEGREGHQNATGIKQKPNPIHELSPLTEKGLCQLSCMVHSTLKFSVSAYPREPRTPRPN